MAHLTPDDLKFLIFNRAALRYQHNHQHKLFLENRKIRGDAYSLSDPHMWHPPDEEKTREFEAELRKTISGMINAGNAGGVGDWFVLLSAPKAREPERRRESYLGPIYPVGGDTDFHADRLLGGIQITDELLGRAPQDVGTPFRSRDDFSKAAERIADKVIEQIQYVSRKASSQNADMETDSASLNRDREIYFRMEDALKHSGLPSRKQPGDWRK